MLENLLNPPSPLFRLVMPNKKFTFKKLIIKKWIHSVLELPFLFCANRDLSLAFNESVSICLLMFLHIHTCPHMHELCIEVTLLVPFTLCVPVETLERYHREIWKTDSFFIYFIVTPVPGVVAWMTEQDFKTRFFVVLFFSYCKSISELIISSKKGML